MTLTPDERETLVAYRLKRADETYAEAVATSKMKLWPATANRLYYAAFYAVSALLLYDGLHAQSHSGIKAMLGMNYIKEGKIDSVYGRTYSKLFEMRQTGDYDDMYDIIEEDVLPYISPTIDLINVIKSYIKGN